MEYQKILKLLDDTTNQPSKLRTRYWTEIDDESRGDYNDDNNNDNDDNNNIKFKTTLISSNLFYYSDAYTLVKRTITVPNTEAAGAALNNTNKKVVFKSCAPFTSCITEINITKVNYSEDIDIVMPIYNLI